ncbi:MAG: YihY/virulence factor BrkB family protein [Thermoguttaceae bacterium]
MLRRTLARAWLLLRAVFSGWQEHGGSLLSAAMAYYAAFSLFPLCLVLMAILGFVGRYSSFVKSEQTIFLERVSQNVSPWLAGELQQILTNVQAHAALGGLVGLAILLLAAIAVFAQLKIIFDRIWSVHQCTARGWLGALRATLWDRLLAFLTLMAVGALLLVVSFADFILAGLRPYLVQLPAGQSTWRLIQWLSTLGCDTLLLTMIYRVLPQIRIRWRYTLAGGFLAAVIWAMGRYLLLLVFAGKQYSAYGVVGVLMGLMLWFYYASAVVFLGAEFIHALASPAAVRHPSEGGPSTGIEDIH